MNLSLTAQALTGALTTALAPLTIEDVCSRRDFMVLTVTYAMPDDLPATHALRWLDRLIDVQKSHRRNAHWAYCSLALKNHVDYRNTIATALSRRGF